jgi:hypothetical protein
VHGDVGRRLLQGLQVVLTATNSTPPTSGLDHAVDRVDAGTADADDAQDRLPGAAWPTGSAVAAKGGADGRPGGRARHAARAALAGGAMTFSGRSERTRAQALLRRRGTRLSSTTGGLRSDGCGAGGRAPGAGGVGRGASGVAGAAAARRARAGRASGSSVCGTGRQRPSRMLPVTSSAMGRTSFASWR